MPQLRLFHLIRSLEIGGEQAYLIRLLNNLDGVYDHIVAYSAGDRLKSEIAEPVRYVKITDRKLRSIHIKTYLMFFQFRRLFRRLKVDCVLLYSPGCIEQFLCALAAHIFRIPVISIPQRAYQNQSGWERLVTLFTPLRRLAYLACDRVIALGSYYKKDFVRNWRIPPHKINLNYIGVDLENLRPDSKKKAAFRDALGLKADCFVFGFVGRLVPVKGLDKALRFYQMLKYHVGSLKIALVVVGDGPLKQRYELKVLRLGLHDVIFLGFRSDIDCIMNGFDVYVQATDHPLNGISSIEALACGKPIVTIIRKVMEREMAADTLADGVNGFFVNLDALERDVLKVSRILNHRNLDVMGKASRRMAEEKFDLSDHTKQLSKMLREIVRKDSPYNI
jgi:glycosyltransferase involved in cell wall biosynthesis